MVYEVINEKLGLARCALADLTMEQVKHFLEQWEPGSSIGSLILFYDEESDLIVFNSSSKSYKFWVDIVEAYLTDNGENAEEYRKRLDEYSKDIRTVLDNCLRVRSTGKELEIIKMQCLKDAYYPVLQRLWRDPDMPSVLLAINAFNYGMMCGKREERSRKAKRQA